jgi:hypothetical protein
MENIPRVTFGLIVLNGEPFVRYNLRAIYPFAHQIVVVEGAVESASGIATEDGHSLDSTLETLRQFKSEEDPENKILFVTKDGYWQEKDEMSRAYADLATGDYLWQVDMDEFYQPSDMEYILSLLKDDPAISVVYFKQITFWGGLDYTTDGWYLRQPQGQGPGIVPRLFKWGPGFQYVTHRQPTIVDDRGIDLRSYKVVNGQDLARKNIFMYHYSLVFQKQVDEKCDYYSKASWAKRAAALKWAKDTFRDLRHPYRVHNVYKYPSWLERFSGTHPPQILALRRDIDAHQVVVEMRSPEDIEALLQSRKYRWGRMFLKILDPLARGMILFRRRLMKVLP